MTTKNKTIGLRISAVVHEYSDKGLAIQVLTVVQVLCPAEHEHESKAQYIFPEVVRL
jgi:hypothetical protein